MQTLLFDIDGTLLLTNNGGRGALQQALQREFELDDAKVDIAFCGRTDRDIVDELLILNDRAANDENRRRLQRVYLSIFPKILNDYGGELLPGVAELLDQLAADSKLCLSVMTGNFQESAIHKLDHFGIRHYFRFIIGGDHDAHRDDLARRARIKILQMAGEAATRRVMVIGDTPADIRCAHAIGARAVGVCTGNYDRESLEAERPFTVLEDLSDLAAFAKLL
ncbi:Phosphoglycolate phosphatase [Novipirellula aureliae]|uniref:phosphoglycolate phosphatase n=1 Tax=Novipirellula aureliae TaxID=2527966 RepID=A0A5C6DSS0_9BACT|nr:HAD family hydrolase [Novipirellula aureliae]TWU37789.1 Phosphoglycolate phosphatase [Novipirellula aureliae]